MAILTANNQSLTEITSLPSGVSGGAMTLLETQTASSSATLSFTSDIDDTYDEYVFKFYDLHPATDNVQFSFQGSTDGGSSYGVTITSTFFRAYNYEGGTDAALEYDASEDLAQSTSFQILSSQCGNDNDQSCSGYLHLFNPSSTTFVKHFIAKINNYHQGDYSMNFFPAGYFNSTSAIDAIQFKMSSGNIDSGDICLYGIK